MTTLSTNTEKLSQLALQQKAHAELPAWLGQRKSEALKRLQIEGLPGRKTENWRYSSLRQLAETDFTLTGHVQVINFDLVQEHVLSPDYVVFVDGIFSAPLSSLPQQAGLTIKSLSKAWLEDRTLIEAFLAKQALMKDKGSKKVDFLANLNQALLLQGLLIQTTKDFAATHPLQVIYLSTLAQSTDRDGNELSGASQNSIYLQLAENSALTLIESFVGETAAANSVRLQLAAVYCEQQSRSRLRHIQLQTEARQTLHFHQTAINQGADSDYQSFVYSAGGRFYRNEVKVDMIASGSRCQLDSFYHLTSSQHGDQHVEVNHLAGHTSSFQTYKGVVADQARGVFNGKIHVHAGTHDCEARQLNRNLMLGNEAEVDSKPELLIDNNDVKCSHGSATTHLDQDEIFYLRSRGISQQNAENMLLMAYALDMFERIPDKKCSHYAKNHFSQSQAGQAQPALSPLSATGVEGGH